MHMEGEHHMSEPEFAMQDLLETLLAERSSDLNLAVDLQPTLTVSGQLATVDVPPVNLEKMDALFLSVASAAHVLQLKSKGCVEFAHDFETAKFGPPAFGRFRVEAKAANGNVVSLKFHRLSVSDQPN